jgi:virginiamycin B lyase
MSGNVSLSVAGASGMPPGRGRDRGGEGVPVRKAVGGFGVRLIVGASAIVLALLTFLAWLCGAVWGAVGRARGRAVVGALVGSLVVAVAATPANAFVYWTSVSGGVLGRANLDGSGVNESFITGLAGPYAVAVDGAHIYWTNYFGGAIERANLDGSGVNQTFVTGLADPYGVAVDGAHIYWTNLNGGAVGRANLDGSGVDQSFITGARSPTGVAVDHAHVYWVNHVNGGTIGRANLDGSGVDQSFITGASPPSGGETVNGPYGVAVDGAHIYWTNYTHSGSLGRANLDGSDVDPTFITGVDYSTRVAVDSAYIYWTNLLNGGAIGRANLDGSGVNQSFITGLSDPYGVAVDSLSGPLPSPPSTAIALAPAAADGHNGWYVSPVHVTVSASDSAAGSGIAETRCVLDPASTPASFDEIPSGCAYLGAGADVTRDGKHVLYAAGVSKAGSEETPVSASFNIDTTPPTVTCNPPPTFVAGGAGGAVSATVSDGTSGPAQTSVSAPADASSAGQKSVSLTGADNAGNQTTVSCSYTVEPKATGLVLTVVNANGHPLAGAGVRVIDSAGRRYSTTSDKRGIAVVHGIADGTSTIHVHKRGYLPATTSAALQGGSGHATITLTPRTCQQLLHRRARYRHASSRHHPHRWCRICWCDR